MTEPRIEETLPCTRCKKETPIVDLYIKMRGPHKYKSKLCPSCYEKRTGQTPSVLRIRMRFP